MASVFMFSLSVGLYNTSHCIKRKGMCGSKKHSYSRQPTTMAKSTDTPIIRRSANYPPSEWSYDFLQSLNGKSEGDKYKTKSQSLKEIVRMMIYKGDTVDNPLSRLELVDDLQRLGVYYHFKDEISNVLDIIYICYYENHQNWNKLDLNLKALGFRILRQHGYHIPQEIFKDITDESGNIKASVQDDIVGMLNLYEASFFSLDDENILDEAREFTSQCLKEKLEQKQIVNKYTKMLITHALELPLHWRIPRFETMWFIESYKGRSDMIESLLAFATLEYNIVQGIYQEDIKYTSRWWAGLQWDKKLNFARDRMVESFMWSVGAYDEPSFSVLRRNATKGINMVNVIDDVYDVYGTLDELEQFTEVMRRWDINAAEGLPDYMKICFLGFYNSINEMAYDTLTTHNSFVLSYVKNAWIEYCETLLVEARWFNSGYIPTLEEFLKNAVHSVGLRIIVTSTYFLDSNDFIGDSLDNVIHWSAMVLRLVDDLGTSTAELARGDVPKSVECYMHETGASKEKARAHIKSLIIEAYKKINKERMACKSPSLKRFMECAINLGRMGQFTYQRGDLFGTPDEIHNSHQMSLLFEPKS